MDQFRKIRFRRPASHFTLPGQTAAKRQGKNADGLTFKGSRLQRFVTDAFAGTLPSGCSVEVANAG